ncbi:GIY-YIG nuclease family protein [bacterium]|nr:GIY-YIG nuclease family protein [bacterium]
MKPSQSELKKQYKMTPRQAGVFRITCTANGRFWLGSSLNIHGPLNRHRMELTTGIHKNEALRADWKQYGPDAFAFEVLETVTDRYETNFSLEDELSLLEEIWNEKTAAEAHLRYNTREKMRQA